MGSKRAGPLGVLGYVLFAAPFLLIGLTMGSAGLLSGQVYIALFGLAFTVGGGITLYAGVREGRSVESRGRPTPAAAPPPPDPSGAGPHAPTARELYGPRLPHLPLTKLPLRRGEALPYALRRRDAHGAWVLLAASLALSGAFLSIYVRELKAMSFGAVIITVGLILFGKLLVSSAKRLLALRKVVVVEVDAEPAYLGDTLRVHVAQRGPARLARLSVRLICKEHVFYGTGKHRRSLD